MISLKHLFCALVTLLPFASAAVLSQRAGQRTGVELSIHYDIAGYTKGDECGKTQGLPAGWSDALQTDPGACGYGRFSVDANIIAVDSSIFKLSDCGKEIKLFKPDGSEVQFGGRPLVLGESCPGCKGGQRLDVSVPLLYSLDPSPCQYGFLSGYSYTITENQVITSGGNPGTPGYVDGAEHHPPITADPTGDAQPAPGPAPAPALEPVVPAPAPAVQPVTSTSDDEIKSTFPTDFEGCRGGVRYMCDAVTNGPDGYAWRMLGGPCVAGAKAI